MKEVKIGLIGLGFMGSTHWRIYESLPQVKVIALADPVSAKRQGDVSKVVGNIGGGDNSQPLNMSGVKVYEDGLEMIADTDADIIDICAPTPEHCKYILAALKAGKHVFCEKPLCGSLQHKSLGTFPSGTIRFSCSVFTSDVDFADLKQSLEWIKDNI